MCQERTFVAQGADEGARRAVRWTLLILLLSGGLAAAAFAGEPPTIPENAAGFNLKEVSTFDTPDLVRSRLLVSAYSECQTEPDSEVKAYPAFQSDKPLYGSIQVGGSGGYRYAVAVDESGGTGQGYDRMYIDTNFNGDLTDNPYQTPMKDVPQKVLMGIGDSGQEVCFEPVTLRVAPGDGPGHQIEVIPRVLVYDADRSFVLFTATKVRQGTIEIGGQKLTAVLGHTGGLAGRFDRPTTALYLLPANDPAARPVNSWYGGDRLMALHRKGNTYYRLAATPSGDKLFVWPYQGAFGTLEAKFEISGSLATEDMAISLTDRLGEQSASSSQSFRLPVGDYAVQMLNITRDTLTCMVLRNGHADGQPRGRTEETPAAYAIRVREDKPFALNFSDKAQVLFAAPARDSRIKPGEQLDVQAVLIDPELDIMFRMVQRQGKLLNPTVAVKRANGQIVAEGAMPFG